MVGVGVAQVNGQGNPTPLNRRKKGPNRPTRDPTRKLQKPRKTNKENRKTKKTQQGKHKKQEIPTRDIIKQHIFNKSFFRT